MKYLGLLYKDFLTQRNSFLAFLAVFAVFLAIFGIAGNQAFVFLMLLFFAPKIVEIVAAFDVSEDFELRLLTTQFSRKDVVRSRYILLAVSLAVFFLLAFGIVLAADFMGFPVVAENISSLLLPALGCSIFYGAVSLPVCILLELGLSRSTVIALIILNAVQIGILIGTFILFVVLTEAVLPSTFGLLAAGIVCCAVSYLVSQRIYAKKEF